MFKHILALSTSLFVLGCVCVLSGNSPAQEPDDQASIQSSIASDGTGKIIIEARGEFPEQAVFYTANAVAKVQVGLEKIQQTVELTIDVIQGDAKTISVGLHGEGRVVSVDGSSTQSWSVRQVGAERFLDLNPKEGIRKLVAKITIESQQWKTPASVSVTHLTSGDTVGFHSLIDLAYDPGVVGKLTSLKGFQDITAERPMTQLQTTTGGLIEISISRSGTLPGPVELVDATLIGSLAPGGQSVLFQLSGTARVSEPDSILTVLSGDAAVSNVPTSKDYRLQLRSDHGRSVYQLAFSDEGSFPVRLEFVALLNTLEDGGQTMDFTMAAGSIVPVTLNGLDADIEFQRDQVSIVPLRDNDAWVGFLPATGRAKLQWKSARKAGVGKLFFTTTGHVEVTVGTGLMRQEHQIAYQVLQGELKSLSVQLNGPGEILDVQGDNVIGWNVIGADEDRRMEITLSQPVSGAATIHVRSQTALGAFPVRVQGMRLNPVGAIRHSGFLRLSNLGLVRLEPTGLEGLTQLSPQQFPGDSIKARQIFVYRFPSSDHSFAVAADRIQPEVNVSELVLYQLAETDRVIRADIELDIREAPIREWDFLIPEDYSVVSVTGAGVADYITASEANDGRRNLNVVFSEDVAGRQLVTFRLEKSQPAAAEDWVLPRIEYPGTKAVRGDIGIMATPGFRVSVGETDLLVEKPLAYFPKPSANLQQAFRIREPAWSATMKIELLEQNIQSDVFHLYSLSQETVYGSTLINYFVTGSPVSQWEIDLPESLENVMVDGQDVRTWRREGDTLIVSLHQPVMGAYTLLLTFEEKPSESNGSFLPGQVAPVAVQGERGYIQVVSPMQVAIETVSVSEDMLKLDPLELPAEFRLLSTAPALGTWQYTERPFDLSLSVDWFQPGTTATQVVEFSEANSRVSKDGELVTDVLYYVKSRGQTTLRVKLPSDPVRLWEVSVDGQPVTARQADDATLIPLPGNTDSNVPVEVRLRLGKPTIDANHPTLTLPIVMAPVLKTQWNITGDQQHVLVPNGGTVAPPRPVLRPTGFNWVSKQGLLPLLMTGLFTCLGIWGRGRTGFLRFLGLLSLSVAVLVSAATAWVAFDQDLSLSPLQLSLPILSAGEIVEMQVANMPLWSVNLSWTGLAMALVGIGVVAWSLFKGQMPARMLYRCVGVLLVSLGVLAQGDAAPWFFGLLAIAIFAVLFLSAVSNWIRSVATWWHDFFQRRSSADETDSDNPSGEFSAVKTTLVFLALAWSSEGTTWADGLDRFAAASSISQEWSVTSDDARLIAKGTITFSGRPGDQFVFLKSPAVLTNFQSEDLRLVKQDVAGEGLTYIISIPVVTPTKKTETENSDELNEESNAEEESESDEVSKSNDGIETLSDIADYQASFQYQLEAIKPISGIPLLTGNAAVQTIDLRYDEDGWEIDSPAAIRIESVETEGSTRARVLLGQKAGSLFLKPRARDVKSEETRFFVEASNLYLPGPGVVDGRHRLQIRTSQGQVSQLSVVVPPGLTVSSVDGPIGSWQFDADSGKLKMDVQPVQSASFSVLIQTQRGLDVLPADVTLAPLQVENADGEVGLVGVAFGPDAQPEKLEATEMSAVNLGDFDASMIGSEQAVLHRVYRYGAEGGSLIARVAPVQPEVRVISKQVLSLGDERIVLGINLTAEITRAGLFQLSFVLPSGLEVESLSGPALHHWAELSEDGLRQIILHLNGKTIGTQTFSLTLSGTAPTDVDVWQTPRFQLNEATRQSGELVVRPTTGIRLRTVSRQNVSETDPRSMGGESQGSLAFRLLQRDWDLVLGIEKLDPWVTGQLLHEMTLREGQTRSTLIANFDVQNASIRNLKVVLPITDEDEMKTLRATGNTISDLIRTAPDSNVWEIQFKRRVVGPVQFRIEFERRGDRDNEMETLLPAEFPQVRQLSYFFGVRAGGRLELEPAALPQGWQPVDWTTIPANLRESENRTAPAFALRAVAPAKGLAVGVKRHSLADSLKLRVAQGSLTTILSPTGDQLTAVEVAIEVIQRSSLSVGLPDGGELLSIFVNGESVNSIRLGENSNVWQFYILPGINDRTANVRFVYAVAGDRLSGLKLTSPELNVPLENIQWNVVAPKGFELRDSDGNLELVGQQNQKTYDRQSYLSKVSGKRQVQAAQAAELLDQANQFLQAGEQTKARWALNSVANQYALDAASNEDARVQLENLQTQQAIVGLNTRRQRLYLDNSPNDATILDNTQLRQAAADNPILQQDQMNFRPRQLSELLRGNTKEDNAILQQIAARLVQHQRTTQPAPQAIIISLPEEGSVYTFRRSVQVTEKAALELDLDFASTHRIQLWRAVLALVLLVMLTAMISIFARRPTIA